MGFRPKCYQTENKTCHVSKVSKSMLTGLKVSCILEKKHDNSRIKQVIKTNDLDFCDLLFELCP